MENNNIKLGLIKGRHPLPVDTYVLTESECSVFTKKELLPIIENNLKELGFKGHYAHQNQSCFEVYENGKWAYEDALKEPLPEVDLYLTGLTIVSLTTVEVFNRWGYTVNVYGFNPNAQQYYLQGTFEETMDREFY